MVMPRQKLPPVHPGEILLEEFLTPLQISQSRLARDLSVPPRRINEIVRGSRAITADTALRLARYFGNSERFWLNLQTRYDLEVEKDRLGDRLEREVAVRRGRENDEAGTPAGRPGISTSRAGPPQHPGG
jgi:addiction module HigA family antidote